MHAVGASDLSIGPLTLAPQGLHDHAELELRAVALPVARHVTAPFLQEDTSTLMLALLVGPSQGRSPEGRRGTAIA